MVTCTHCNTSNGLDGKFCKSCGLELQPEAIQEAVGKHQELIQEGYNLFNQGRTEEAALVAELAIEQNPSSGTALSLRGMCFEREAKIAEALECYERVLEMSPDSALDRIKVNQLRTLLAAQLQIETPPNRKVALLGAALSVVLVGVVGAIVATVSTRPAGAATNTNVANPNLTAPFSTSLNPSQLTYADPNRQPTTSPTNEPAVQPEGVNQQPVRRPDLSYGTGSSIPQVGPNGRLTGPIENGSEPIRISLDAQAQEAIARQNAAANATKPPESDPDPEPVIQKPEEDKTKVKRPVVEITVLSDGTKTGGSQDVGGAPETSDNLVRVGQQQYLAQNFGAAAQSYEKAIRNGQNTGPINQRLAQCYEKLGKREAAISAYSRAVSAYEAAGSPAAESCRLQLKLLRGN